MNMVMSGIEFVKLVQEFRNPWFDQFFRALNFFDTLWFFIMLVPIVWIWFGWKVGLKIFYILVISHLAVNSLKDFFEILRPYQIDPSLGLIRTSGGGFAFPSGAATTVVLLSCILISAWKSPWSYSVAFIYITLISISRVYLGMHFLKDLIGGWALGFALWLVYAYLFPLIEKWLNKMKPTTLLVISQAIPLLLLSFLHTYSAIVICGIAMTTGIGLFTCRRRMIK